MLHTFCNTYHVQFGFVTWKANGLCPLRTTLEKCTYVLIFLKDTTFTQGSKERESSLSLTTPLNLLTAFKFLSKRLKD